MKLRTVTASMILSLAVPALVAAMPDMKPPAAVEEIPATPITGKTLEVINSSGYTYLLLEKAGTKYWVAIPELFVAVGDEVELKAGTQMGEFTSKPLNRTFDQIIFSNGPTKKYDEKRKMSAHKGVNMSEPAPGNKKPDGKVVEGLKVDKAKGENAYDLAEIIAKRAELQNKTVSVRAQVVKITTGVMDRNWAHIKDGTGENGANKLVVTTKAPVNIGDIVTFTGVFHNNVDFGGGYQYAIILEDATVDTPAAPK